MYLEAPINLVKAVDRAISIRPIIRPRSPIELSSNSTKDQLRVLTDRAHEVLFSANSVFPFDLFPDTITIDREKLTIINRLFFKVAKIISVPVRDILSVEADVGPFFGSLRMTSRYFSTNPMYVNFLSRSNTIKLQRLLQGYIIAHEEGVEGPQVEKNELIKMLYDLGNENKG